MLYYQGLCQLVEVKSSEMSSELMASHAFSTEEPWSIPKPVLTTFLFVFGTAAVLGNIMNLLVLKRANIFTRQQSLLLLILAVTDLTTGLQCIVGVFLQFFKEDPDNDSNFLCKTSGLLISLCCGHSSVTIMFIAADKTIAVLKPLRYPTLVTTFRIKLFSLIFVLIELLLLLVISSREHFCDLEGVDYIREYGTCVVNFHDEERRVWIVLFAFVVVFQPGILIVVMCFTVAVISRRQSRRTVPVSFQTFQMLQKMKQKEWKGFKLAVVISVSFLCPWLFFTSLEIYQAFSNNEVNEVVKHVAGVLTVSNSWCNTLIYFVSYRKYRQTAANLIANIFRSSQKDDEHIPLQNIAGIVVCKDVTDKNDLF